MTWHPKAQKDLKALDRPVQKQILDTIGNLISREPTTLAQSHPLNGPLKGWTATKASRGHRITHQTQPDGTLHIGHIGLHNYDDAIRRLTVRQRPDPDPIEYRHIPPTRHPSEPDARGGGFHAINAYDDGKQVGRFHWYDPEDAESNYLQEKGPWIDGVEVASTHRRQGLGAEMLRRAREITPGIKHSDRLSGDGRAWRDGVSPEEAGTPASRVLNQNRLGALRTEAGPEDYAHYRMRHQAPEPEEHSSFDDPSNMMPDVHEHPEYYAHRPQDYYESHPPLLKARGKPDANVTIYRAVPHGVTTINPGDWVTQSRSYAKEHAESQGCPGCGKRMQVLQGTTKAKHLHNEGYLTEWGYTGDDEIKPTNRPVKWCPNVHKVSGEIEHHPDGTVGHTCKGCGEQIGIPEVTGEKWRDNDWHRALEEKVRQHVEDQPKTNGLGRQATVEDIQNLLGPSPKSPAEHAAEPDEAERMRKIDEDWKRHVQEHKEWQAARTGVKPGDDISAGQMGHEYPHAEWVPIEVARHFRDHTGDQHSGSEETVQGIHKGLTEGQGMTDPLMLLHHNEANRAHLGEGNHRLVAAERAGWTHVPMRVVRMYDGEAERGKGKQIPLQWRGTHQGQTPEMCKPSDVLDRSLFSSTKQARYEVGHQVDRDRDEDGNCHYYPFDDHEHGDQGNGEIECPYSSSHTDWDREHPKLGDIHRGLQLLPPHEDWHKMPDHEKAHSILESLRSSHEDEAELGSHWSRSEQVSKGYADPGTANRHGVVFHAEKPAREDIQEDPEWLNDRASFGIDHHDDQEVPIREGSPVHIKGVSWLDHDGWKRHDFEAPQQHHAKVKVTDSGPDGKPATGIMIAIVPPKRIARLLEIEGGEPQEQLHVTLAFLGDKADYSKEMVEDLPEVVAAWAETVPQTTATSQGAGTFVPATEDGKHVLWAAVDIPGVHRMHRSLVEHLKAHGYAPKEDFEYHPHLTLGYSKYHWRFIPKVTRMKWTVREVWTVIGGTWESHPLS